MEENAAPPFVILRVAPSVILRVAPSVILSVAKNLFFSSAGCREKILRRCAPQDDREKRDSG